MLRSVHHNDTSLLDRLRIRKQTQKQIQMKDLIIDATSETPSVTFMTSGRLRIQGCSFPENTAAFYSRLIDWAQQLGVATVTFDINLYYLNTSSSHQMLELLRCLDDNGHISEFNVNWYFEDEDDDILESGQIYEDMLNKATFLYHTFTKAA